MSILGDAIGLKKKPSAPVETNSASLGPRYQQLLDANPYRNQTYQASPWQNFLSALGFRTQADAWKENMAVQAAEYDAAIAQKAYDENYDSAAEQTARLRAAGLNPDITGGQNVSSGESASLPQDPSTPMQSTGDEEGLQQVVSMATQIAGGCMNAFSTALGIVQSIQGIHRNRLDNTMQAIQNEGAFQSLADQILPYVIPRTPEQSEEGDTWYTNALNAARLLVGDMPKKMQAKALRAINSRLASAPTERKAFEEWSGRVSARKAYYQGVNEFYNESDEILNIISSGLAKMNEDIYKQYQSTQLAEGVAGEKQAENEAEYYGTLSGRTQAEAENSANELSKTNNAMVETMRKNLKDIVDKLEAASKGGGIKGGLASVSMTLISMLQLWISSQGAPSVSRSSSSSYKVGPRSQAGSESQSFSIGF